LDVLSGSFFLEYWKAERRLVKYLLRNIQNFAFFVLSILIFE